MIIDEETEVNLNIIKTLISQLEDELFELVENDKMDEAFKLAERFDKITENKVNFLDSLNY